MTAPARVFAAFAGIVAFALVWLGIRPVLIGFEASSKEFPGVAALTIQVANGEDGRVCTGVVVEVDSAERFLVSTHHCGLYKISGAYVGGSPWSKGTKYTLGPWAALDTHVVAARLCSPGEQPPAARLAKGPLDLTSAEDLVVVGWSTRVAGLGQNRLARALHELMGTDAAPNNLSRSRPQHWAPNPPQGPTHWETTAGSYSGLDGGDCGAPLFGADRSVVGIMVNDYSSTNASPAVAGGIFSLGPHVAGWLAKADTHIPSCP